MSASRGHRRALEGQGLGRYFEPLHDTLATACTLHTVKRHRYDAIGNWLLLNIVFLGIT